MSFPELEKEIRNELETIISRYWSSRISPGARRVAQQGTSSELSGGRGMDPRGSHAFERINGSLPNNSERANRARRRRTPPEPIIIVRQFPWRIGGTQDEGRNVPQMDSQTERTHELPSVPPEDPIRNAYAAAKRFA